MKPFFTDFYALYRERMSQGHYLSGFLCLIFTFFYLLATHHGNQYSLDAEAYRTIAENLYYRGELKCPENLPLVYWPPLYPLVLAPGVPVFGSYVFVLHLLCGCGIITFWVQMAEKEARGMLSHQWMGFSITLSTPLLLIATFIWSEILFLLLFSGYLFFLKQYLIAGSGSALIKATIFGFLMLLERNAGIFLLTGVGIGFALNQYKYSCFNLRRAGYEMVHLLLVVSGFAFWNIKKIIVEHHQHIFAELVPQLTITRNFYLSFGELGASLLPSQLFGNSLAWLTLATLIGMGYTVLVKIKEPFLVILLASLWIYMIVWLIVPAMSENIARFVAVVVPLFLWLLWQSLEYYKSLFSKRQQNILYGICGLYLGYLLIRIIHNALLWSTRGS